MYKREIGLQPWAIQVLTADYLISGLSRPEDDIFYYVQGFKFADPFEGPVLESVDLQPTGNLVTPRQHLEKWRLAYCATVIAIIPSDQAGLGAARATFYEARHPLPVVLYAGPYVVQATLLSEDPGGETLFTSRRSFIPAAGAHIECQAPGTQWKGIRVPWLLLNGGLLQGYSPQEG